MARGKKMRHVADERIGFWLGGMPDTTLAELSGLTKQQVYWWRRKRGIPPCRVHECRSKGFNHMEQVVDRLLAVQDTDAVMREFHITHATLRQITHRKGVKKLWVDTRKHKKPSSCCGIWNCSDCRPLATPLVKYNPKDWRYSYRMPKS